MSESHPKLNDYVDFFRQWVARKYDVDLDQVDIRVSINYEDGEPTVVTTKERVS